MPQNLKIELKEKQTQKQKPKLSELYNVPVSEKYFLVGKRLSREETEKLGLPWKKAGPGEVWIEIPKRIIDERGGKKKKKKEN